MTLSAPPAPTPHRVLACCLAVVAVLGVALAGHLASDAHRLADPNPGLRQLDYYYLDEPAPLLDRVGGEPDGRPLLLMVCADCEPPTLRDDVDAEVRRTDDLEVARAYGLLTDDGRIGPGYVIVDSGGAVRYRTFDAALGAHGEEVRVLLRGLR